MPFLSIQLIPTWRGTCTFTSLIQRTRRTFLAAIPLFGYPLRYSLNLTHSILFLANYLSWILWSKKFWFFIRIFQNLRNEMSLVSYSKRWNTVHKRFFRIIIDYSGPKQSARVHNPLRQLYGIGPSLRGTCTPSSILRLQILLFEVPHS